MKKGITLILLLASWFSFSQIGIGTATPNASAALDVTSTNRGLLPPRMTYAQKMAILSPALGLMLWCTNCSPYGEMQVYNGTTWTTTYGETASLAIPDAPTNLIPTAFYQKVSLAFIPGSDGGSSITNYRVTASPGGIFADGIGSPIEVLGLTNGIAYTFTVVATNAVGNSIPSVVSQPIIPNCGAYTSNGTFLRFSCYNLGANASLDPHNPVQGIHGNYYQWGSSTIVATAFTAAGAISDWNITPALNGAWTDATKTSNDPCPTGFRVPTNAQWLDMSNNSFNTISRTGTWVDNANNFTTAISFGTPTIKTLTLPTAGYRNNTNGTLTSRSFNGFYWSSTENGINSSGLYFTNASFSSLNLNRLRGFSVRCISE